MARSLKTRGLAELELLKKRVRRQFGLGRISAVDADYLDQRIKEVEARIISMREADENGEEEW